MKITAKNIAKIGLQKTDCMVVPIFSKRKMSAAAKQVDNSVGGLIKSALANGEMQGNTGQTLMLHCPATSPSKRILLVGCGNQNKLDQDSARKILSGLIIALKNGKAKSVTVALDELSGKNFNSARLCTLLSQQATEARYSYSETVSKPAKALALKSITVSTADTLAANAAIKRGLCIGVGIITAKQLGNLPGNICTPSYLASEARKLGRRSKKLTTRILEEAQMEKLGMGALLSVSAGSAEPAKLIVMNYQGAARAKKPYVLVGKGITFDSGGISLKPGAKMDEMKYDMCGAASVFGVMQSVVAMQLPLNITGIVPASENMPSSKATKPGDVVTSMSGQTIEILNTDAEGRLVLCDALTYAEQFKPAAVVDIATLTGACVVALGAHATALYSNDEKLAEQLLQAGTTSHDRAWRMPLWDDYQRQIDTPFADVANVGGPGGGSITAACFLERFARQYSWAHLDIAGTAWSSAPKASTGRPVAMLLQYLQDRAA